MGVAQNQMQGLATTILAAGAMAGKVSADMEKAEAAKSAEAESLQDKYLATNDEISNMSKEHQELSDKINTASLTNEDVKGDPELKAARTGARNELNQQFTDMQAAKRAQANLADKVQAATQRNERTAARFKRLTHQTIIGGNR